jgi:hypothetical protein
MEDRRVILQLNPPIHFWIPEREDYGLAHFVINESPEEYLYFVCIMQKTGEVWTFDNRKVRGDVNFTLERVYNKRVAA